VGPRGDRWQGKEPPADEKDGRQVLSDRGRAEKTTSLPKDERQEGLLREGAAHVGRSC